MRISLGGCKQAHGYLPTKHAALCHKWWTHRELYSAPLIRVLLHKNVPRGCAFICRGVPAVMCAQGKTLEQNPVRLQMPIYQQGFLCNPWTRGGMGDFC